MSGPAVSDPDGAPDAAALYLAVDCSTTAAKAVLFDRDGIEVGVARRPLEMSRPRPGWHEQDPVAWWDATREAVTEVVAAVGRPADIRCLCLTHQRESFVCLDSAGRPLRPAVLWLDSRADREIAELGSPRVQDLSGKPPDVTPALYKMAWLRRHEPAVLRDAARVGDVQAYLVRRLTGRWATGTGSADALGLFDLRGLTWAPELLELAGVEAAQLPDLVASGEQVGRLTPEVAAGFGLPAPVPVVAGTGDGQAAGLGADATRPGTAYLNLGTSMVLGVDSPSYLSDPAFRTMAGPVTGRYTLETILNSATYLAGWFRMEFGRDALDGAPDPALDREAAAIPIGADGLLTLPYWNCAQTPYWDPVARGATVGWHGGHTRAHFYRSILEAVAYELRLHLAGLEARTGHPIDTLCAVGGGTRSVLWLQIVADATQRRLLICDGDETSAKGAAVLARAFDRGDGNAGIPAAAGAMASYARTIDPDPGTAAAYDRYAAVHRTLYPQLKGVFADLAAAGRRA